MRTQRVVQQKLLLLQLFERARASATCCVVRNPENNGS